MFCEFNGELSFCIGHFSSSACVKIFEESVDSKVHHLVVCLYVFPGSIMLLGCFCNEGWVCRKTLFLALDSKKRLDGLFSFQKFSVFSLRCPIHNKSTALFPGLCIINANSFLKKTTP